MTPTASSLDQKVEAVLAHVTHITGDNPELTALHMRAAELAALPPHSPMQSPQEHVPTADVVVVH
ncbi:MAG: hypothetical protein KDC46_06540 [Thermoleophilia bacterium]|nr:hypothetical protein [Thermoleophilia bacterium]